MVPEPQHGSPKRRRPGGRAAQVKERVIGIAAARLWFQAVSQHVHFSLSFFQVPHRALRGAKPHADEQSEKVRRLWARSVSNSKVLYGSSVKRFSFGFSGTTWAAFGIGRAFEVSWGSSEAEQGAGDFSQVQQ